MSILCWIALPHIAVIIQEVLRRYYLKSRFHLADSGRWVVLFHHDPFRTGAASR
ncbi:hypothetical protein HMPREF9080_02145 [Cardiobacterium valvarum F0432]|uniref:Uncharacterized protein n=1 Tax=Cardiobacterium valvarum F0432 TaxID=797473 RepID=G9ZH88_9GAMM|nr:hypothetical protein HMPREF9080_02145 [Cardiobacterium valvarum F0432]